MVIVSKNESFDIIGMDRDQATVVMIALRDLRNSDDVTDNAERVTNCIGASLHGNLGMQGNF